MFSQVIIDIFYAADFSRLYGRFAKFQTTEALGVDGWRQKLFALFRVWAREWESFFTTYSIGYEKFKKFYPRFAFYLAYLTGSFRHWTG